MKLTSLLPITGFLFLTACGGAATNAAKSSSSGASGGGSRESCKELSALICKTATSESTSCQSIRTIVDVLPVSSCVEAMKEPTFILARLNEQRSSCTQLTAQLCQIMGENSASCALVKDQAPKFDSARCQNMLAHQDEVVADLKQMERESAPLSLEDQQAIAASDAPSFGVASAKVTVVLFSDFQCPYCAKAADVVTHLKAHYVDKIRFVFRQFPLNFHEHAKDASEAALFAQAGGKFWEFHDQLFKNQEHLDTDALEVYAKAVGLDPKALRESLAKHSFGEQVKTDLALGERISVRGTPTLFINGKRSSNATSVQAVAAEIEAALAE